jgi:hypothetical protein
VPIDKIRYDNLKPAVSRVLFGRTRVESDRWVAFKSHYGFDSFYCRPGHEGSHEKGGVEGEGGRFRRNHCVPMPVVDSIEELNELLEPCDDSAGTRALIEVLLLHRHLEYADVLDGISAALTVGSVSADVVAVEARKSAQRRDIQPPPAPAVSRSRQVMSLTERRLVDLPSDDRPLPSVDAYDDLLGKASS